MEERLYNVSLTGAYDRPSSKRAKYAVNTLRSFVLKHMKSKNMNVSEMVNKLIWSRSISKPPRHIKIKTIKKDDVVYILLPDEKLKGEPTKDKKAQEKDKKKADEAKKKAEESKKKKEAKKPKEEPGNKTAQEKDNKPN